MGFLIVNKNEEDPIKNEGARVVTTLFTDFYRHSRAAYSKVSDGIFPKFKTHPSFYSGLVICKNNEDS